jgi:Uncharacterized conserved protein (DUF2358)
MKLPLTALATTVLGWCCWLQLLLVLRGSDGFSPELPTGVRWHRESANHGDLRGSDVGRPQQPRDSGACSDRHRIAAPAPFADSTRLKMSSVPSTSAGLSSLEVGAVVWMERMYSKTLAIKCPFFRRRAADLLDSIDMILRFVVIRHKSLDVVGPPPSWRAPDASSHKCRDLPVHEVVEALRRDWRPETNKGYYVTGRLNATIYRDDCLFDGPDPDMPVRGLRKYLNAASQLFDQGKSRCELLSLEVVDDSELVARWRMNGVLRLPWKPVLPLWTGTTYYYRDDRGLIYKHDETWDLTVFHAFMLTFLPSLSRHLGLAKGPADKEPESVSTTSSRDFPLEKKAQVSPVPLPSFPLND